MKEKIKIRCFLSMKEVEATLLPPIAGFEKYKFYLHETVSPNNTMGYGEYTVTESITGMAMAHGNTSKGAIKAVQMRLQNLGLEDFESRLSRWCDLLGIKRELKDA